ncbi:sensitivity to high expression protein she9 [Nowakowskiella sp. JEL0078]|nr:sensitivity to high expression protein she9 [Nowakowskiella sp. JEL0078]
MKKWICLEHFNFQKSKFNRSNLSQNFSLSRVSSLNQKSPLLAEYWSILNSTVNTSLTSLRDTIPKDFSNLNIFLNNISGYDNVEKLKKSVFDKEKLLSVNKEQLQKAKRDYDSLLTDIKRCQSEINSLLQRKHSWVDGDADRLGELHRKELSLDHEEKFSKLDLREKEEAFERSHVEYLSEIRERYIEEQLFSDKIRKASTFWTWYVKNFKAPTNSLINFNRGLIGLQISIFILLNLVVEPRKRKRFERELVEILQSSTEERDVKLQQIINSVVAMKTTNKVATSLITSNENKDKILKNGSKEKKPAAKDQDSWTKWISDEGFWLGLGTGMAATLSFIMFFSKSG